MATLSQSRTVPMPVLFSYGFRPFFLFGALYGGLAILVWSAGRAATAISGMLGFAGVYARLLIRSRGV